jgi:subtilisin family serine protease
MVRIGALAFLAAGVLALGADRHLPASPAAGGGGRTEVVVALASPPLATGGAAARVEREQRAFRAALAKRVPDARVRWRYRLVANGFAVDLPQSELGQLRRLPGVREVYASVEYGPQLDRSPQQIGASQLWGPGLASAGQGVKIGIIDSGIDRQHVFFDPSGYSLPAGFPKGQRQHTTAKVIVARAFPPPGASGNARLPADEHGHGTHVAGIAAGNASTRAPGGRLVSGVAPRAYLGNYKVFVPTESGLSPNANAPEITAAIEAAVADGMDVINFSGGEPEIEPNRDIVALAFDAAAAAGVVPVVAAGNDYEEFGAGSVSSPANSTRAISVAAVETEGIPGTSVHADFSSVGPTTISLRLKPDVAAPGVQILSSVPGGWASVSGTSMAAPHVAGASALLRQRHPGWTVAQIKSALVQTGTNGLDERDRLLGPQFQGGGVVSLPRADRPLLFADPAGLSFGLQARGATFRGAIELDDAEGGAGVWQVTGLLRESPAGVTLALPASVEVPGTLPYELTTSPSAGQGDRSGYIELRRGSDVRRIPFWGRVTLRALAGHAARALRQPGLYRGTTQGQPALVTTYRYPENPSGVGVTTVLTGPEAVYRLRIARRVANFGAVITRRAAGSSVEPRVVAGLDEDRLTGYAGLPIAHNPYLENFHDPVLAAGALSPRPGEYGIVFDSARRAGAGPFTFRLWIDDVTPPTLRLRTRRVDRGDPILVAAIDRGSGVYPDLVRASIDGRSVRAAYRRGVVRIGTTGLSPGAHRLRLRVSDYQETKNTENVARILPNTRFLTATVTIRP